MCDVIREEEEKKRKKKKEKIEKNENEFLDAPCVTVFFSSELRIENTTNNSARATKRCFS
jgi:hypothetical protein